MRNLKNKLERIYRKAARTLVERGVEGSHLPESSDKASLSETLKPDPATPEEGPTATLGDASGELRAPETPPQSPRGPAGSTLEDLGGAPPAQQPPEVSCFVQPWR